MRASSTLIQVFYYEVWVNPGPYLFISTFSHYNSNLNRKKGNEVDVVLGIQTRRRRIVGADRSTELWRSPPCFSTKSPSHLFLFKFDNAIRSLFVKSFRLLWKHFPLIWTFASFNDCSGS